MSKTNLVNKHIILITVLDRLCVQFYVPQVDGAIAMIFINTAAKAVHGRVNGP